MLCKYKWPNKELFDLDFKESQAVKPVEILRETEQIKFYDRWYIVSAFTIR